jgi:hypothetical protein
LKVRRGAALLAALTCGVLASTPARAQSEGEKKAAAQALFDEGRQLATAGSYAEACPKLVESLRLDPVIGTRFYLAECFEHVGKLASAWTYYLEVADAAKAAGQKDREKYANDRAEALRPRLAKLALKVPEAARAIPGLSIARDGVAVGEAQWGTAIPVDLGAHAVTVSAPKKKPWTTTVDVGQEGQLAEVAVPTLEAEAPPPPPPPPVITRIEPPPPPPPPPPSGRQRVAGFVVGGVGVIGLGVGAGLGGMALSKKSQSNADGHCDAADRCDGTGLALRNQGLSAAAGSTVGFVVGGVALVTGIVLVATAPSARKPAPVVALGPGGASLSWRW